MKRKKIDLTETFESVDKIICLADFLMYLSVKGGEDLREEMIELQQEHFCGDCQMQADNCACNGRYMREYDDGADYED